MLTAKQSRNQSTVNTKPGTGVHERDASMDWSWLGPEQAMLFITTCSPPLLIPTEGDAF